MSEKISITAVPQADELAKVLLTVEAVHNGSKTDAQIADYVGFTDRQGRYYRLAASILGLLENDNNNAVLTKLGEDLIVFDTENRLKKVRSILKENELFSRLVNFIESRDSGVNRSELISFLRENIDGSDSTIDRRLYTLINWLKDSELVKLDIRELENQEKETVYKYNDLLEEQDFLNETSFKDGIYPADYTEEELDIKESHIQVIGLVRKKEQGNFIVPEFQRNQVWKQQQKSRFIESLILNIPVPPFYLSQSLDGSLIIVDGLQRSSAIFEFLSDKWPLVGLEALPHLNGKTYSALDKFLKARIEDRDLLLYILKPTVPMAIVYDIFNRINSNGTPLTRQEIRNCIYIGSSTRLLSELSEETAFRKAIDNGIPSLRMKDREAILRFLAFILYDFETDYIGDLDDFLSKTMRRINRMLPAEISALEKRFNRVMAITFNFFGKDNFRLPTHNSRGRINIALMEVISVFFDEAADSYLATYKDQIINDYYTILLMDNDFINSVRISTGSKHNVKTRFTKVFEILNES